MMPIMDKRNCSGCRACEQICPQGCISMVADEEGFLYPQIDEKKCINCNKCTLTCKKQAKASGEAKYAHRCFAVKNRNKNVRLKSSSGGMFFGVADYVLKHHGVVFGAVFDEEWKVCHIGTEKYEDVCRMRGSKYVQSDTKNTFAEAREYLNAGRMVLYTGTPCQIAGLKKFLGKEYKSLYCVSLICLGVPSPEVWRKYLAYQKGYNDSGKIRDVQFRKKNMGGTKCIKLYIDFEKETKIYDAEKDCYYKGFLTDLTLRPSCYGCRYRGENNVADIIIGDFWGLEKYYPEMEDRAGTSAVIVNTDRGMDCFNAISMTLDVVECSYAEILAGNPMLEKSAHIHANRYKFFKELGEHNQVEKALRENLVMPISTEERYTYQYPIILKYLQNKIAQKSMVTFFKHLNCSKVAIYAMTEFAELVLEDIKEEVDVVLCDKNYRKYLNGYNGNSVLGIDQLVDLYKNGKIDKIVICSIFHSNEVFEELKNRGIMVEDMISVMTAIYCMEE